MKKPRKKTKSKPKSYRRTAKAVALIKKNVGVAGPPVKPKYVNPLMQQYNGDVTAITTATIAAVRLLTGNSQLFADTNDDELRELVAECTNDWDAEFPPDIDGLAHCTIRIHCLIEFADAVTCVLSEADVADTPQTLASSILGEAHFNEQLASYCDIQRQLEETPADVCNCCASQPAPNKAWCHVLAAVAIDTMEHRFSDELGDVYCDRGRANIMLAVLSAITRDAWQKPASVAGEMLSRVISSTEKSASVSVAKVVKKKKSANKQSGKPDNA